VKQYSFPVLRASLQEVFRRKKIIKNKLKLDEKFVHKMDWLNYNFCKLDAYGIQFTEVVLARSRSLSANCSD